MMSRKAKTFYLFLTLLVMSCFAMVGVMFSEGKLGYGFLFLILAVLLAGMGFSMKKRLLK